MTNEWSLVVLGGIWDSRGRGQDYEGLGSGEDAGALGIAHPTWWFVEKEGEVVCHLGS